MSTAQIAISVDPQKEAERLQKLKADAGQYTVVRTVVDEVKDFSTKELKQAWFRASQNMENERLRRLMPQCEIMRKTELDTHFEVVVNSKLMLDLLETDKMDVVHLMRDFLQNKKVTFDISFQEENETGKKMVTHAEVFQQMMKENEAFRRLAQELTLEVN